MIVAKFCRPTQTGPLWTRYTLADVGAKADALTTWSSSFHDSKMRLGNSNVPRHPQLPRLIGQFQQPTISILIFRLSKELICKLTSSQSYVNNIMRFERCELRKYWRHNMTSPVDKVRSEMSRFLILFCNWILALLVFKISLELSKR